MVWSLQAIPQLSDEQFALWSRLLEERAGIYLSAQQKTFLQTQVIQRMRELAIVDYGEYYNLVVDGLSGLVEWTQLVDRLVVNETRFFRHRASVDFIGQMLVQRMALVHAAGSQGASSAMAKDSFDIWSVGCSSGEEPYSLAMVINDAYHMVGREARFSITATDISRAALTIARAGIYGERKLETVDRTFQHRYFTKVAEKRYQVAAHLRDRICFNHGNVLNINEMPALKVDVIYCQNLLVYFRRWLREHILNAFVERLQPGGLLVIGLGEVVGWSHPTMRRVTNDAVQAYVHN